MLGSLVSPVTFSRLGLLPSSSRTETPPPDNSLKKKYEFVVSATAPGNSRRRKRQQPRNEDISTEYGSDSEENQIASGVVGHAVLAKIRAADKTDKGTATTTTAKSLAATTTSLSGSDVLLALLNSSSKSSTKKKRKGRSSYTSRTEDENEDNGGGMTNDSLMRPLHIKKEWGFKLDELGRCLEELILLHDSR